MKRLLSITLLLVLAYNLCGVFVVFKYRNYVIRKEMKMKIKSGVSEEELAVIKVDAKNENELIWKHSREFKYKGIMYDVVKKEQQSNDVIIYYCVTDSQETELFEDLNSIVREESNSKHDNKNTAKRIIDLFSHTLVAEELELNLVSDKKKYSIYGYNVIYDSPFLESFYSPPQV